MEVLNKQIQSGTSGEVFIQPADAKSNCIEGGNLAPGNARCTLQIVREFVPDSESWHSKVWVLQGSCLDIQQDRGCSLAVPCLSTNGVDAKLNSTCRSRCSEGTSWQPDKPSSRNGRKPSNKVCHVFRREKKHIRETETEGEQRALI